MMQRPIGVIGAMTVEISALVSAAHIERTEEHASMTFHLGTLSGVPVVIVKCGEGKVNAGICAQILADLYSPRAVLNIGVAGGVGEKVRIGSAVVASSCVEHDADSSPLGYRPGEVFLPPDSRPVMYFPCDSELSRKLLEGAGSLYDSVFQGVIVSGDQFIATAEKGRELRERFAAAACEMEGAAVAHVCCLNGIPCAVLRAISDNANEESRTDFPTFAQEAAEKAQKLLLGVIETL